MRQPGVEVRPLKQITGHSLFSEVFMTGARAENIQKTGKGVKLTLTTKDGKQEQLEAEKLLVAVGRKPNTDSIGLENTKVQLDRGFIKVDQNQQTAEPGVYAIGDVVAGTPQLATTSPMA